MQHKDRLNYPRLITPEMPMGFKHSRLRQVKGTVFMDSLLYLPLFC